MTNSVAAVSSSTPLTQSDISRLPQGAAAQAAAQPAAAQGLTADVYGEPKESHTLRNTIIGLVVAAGALVGLRHCGFIKNFKTGAEAKWYDSYIRKPIFVAGDYIQKGVLWPYNKVKGWFSKAPAPGPEAPTA